MIPDWVEYTKDTVEVVATLGGMFLGYTRIIYHLGQQDGRMSKMGAAIDAGNDVTKAVAEKVGSIPPGPMPRATSSVDLSAHLGDEGNGKP